jgi:hypothetical protein
VKVDAGGNVKSWLQADCVGSNFVVYYGLVVLADTKSISQEVSKKFKREEKGHTKRLSSLSLYGPLLNPSGLSCLPLMNVPFEFFGVKICKNSDQFRQDIL